MTTQETIAQAVWTSAVRTLASGVPDAPNSPQTWIAKAIWEYSIRLRTITGLALWCRLNDALATTDVFDSSGHGLTGAATRNTVDMSVAGKVGTALSFNGTDLVDFGDPDSLKLTTFSIAAWVKSDRAQTGAQKYWWIANRGSAYGAGFGIDFYDRSPASVGRFEVWSRGASYAVAYALNTDEPVGQWNHVVGTYDGTNLRIYVNGTLRQTEAGTSPSTASMPFRVGDDNRSDSGGLSWFGPIDDVRIHSFALTLGQIQTLYNAYSGSTNAEPWLLGPGIQRVQKMLHGGMAV